MANFQKYPKSSLGHLLKHYERSVDENGQHIRYGNQDIKTDLSSQNYNLGPDRDIDQLEFIKKRTSEVSCLNRKDVNVMCSWVVTLPKELPLDQEREFFEKTYDFLQKRYGGEENVISSYVHLDENRPHMHFSFVPVVQDKKKGHLKVSAKEAVNRIDLQKFHLDLAKTLELHFKRDLGIINEATKEGNKSIVELKRGTALLEVKEQKNILENQIKSLQSEKQGLESKLNTLKSDLNHVRDNLRTLDDVKFDLNKIDSLEAKFGVLNKNKVTIDADEFESLKKLAKKSIVLEKSLANLTSEKNSAQADLKKTYQLLQEDREKNQKITRKYKALKKENDTIKEILGPENMEKVMKRINLQEQKGLEKTLKPKVQDLEV